MKAGTDSVGIKGGRMKNIVDETGEIIAKATDEHTLIGGHHRLAKRSTSVIGGKADLAA